MKIKNLIQDLPITLYKGNKETSLLGLCSHSKQVAPGDLFIAKKGLSCDGSEFVHEALASGAYAILSDLEDPFLPKVAQLIHPDPASIEGILADRFYGSPSKHLDLVGVTGTNGKTSVSSLIRFFFEELGTPCGLIGTLGYFLGLQKIEADRTTPDVLSSHRYLRDMRKAGCKACAMEVSSHALAQNRTDCLAFDTAIFTNLSQDHLDYHGTMEEYAKQKAKLFQRLEPQQTAIVSAHSSYLPQMIDNCKANIFRYGIGEGCDLFATHLSFASDHTKAKVHYGKQKGELISPLLGRFNVLNVLAAMSVFLIRGVPLFELLEIAKKIPPLPGRLEKVEKAPCQVFVDYAHTPEALEGVLQTLRELPHKKIITLFGCGGDRDRGKREKMGEVADCLSDHIFLTSDNPRKEDPFAICTQIAKGIDKTPYEIEVDRKKAIEKALSVCSEKDILLVAGKGHETYQIFGYRRIPFSDRKVVEELSCEVMH